MLHNVCECRKPKPMEITDDTFEGLFVDVPIRSTVETICSRCALVLLTPPPTTAAGGP